MKALCPAPPGRPPLRELGPRQRHDEERGGARPLQQVLDEVEQRGVRPLEVLEDQDDRIAVGEPFEEQPPGAEQLVAIARTTVLEPDQGCEPGLDPSSLVRLPDLLVEHRPELGHRRLAGLLLGDPALPADHLRERPVGQAVSVGRAAATEPVHVACETVEVAAELRGQPRLPGTGATGDRHEEGAALVRRGVVRLLDDPKLAVASDERWLETGEALAPDDPKRTPELHRLRLPLQLVTPRVRVSDHRCRGRTRGVADEHRAWIGDRLDPRRRVHHVSGDHPLVGRADGDGGLAGQHAGSGTKVGRSDLRPERLDRRDQVEPCPHGALGIILGRDRRAPDGHHRVADELLDHAPVPLDQLCAGLEVAGQELAHLFGVSRLRERGEPHQIGEQHRDEAALLTGQVSRDPSPICGWLLGLHPGAAFAAEAIGWRVRGSTSRTGEGELGPTLGTELSAGSVLGAAGSARDQERRAYPSPGRRRACR